MTETSPFSIFSRLFRSKPTEPSIHLYTKGDAIRDAIPLIRSDKPEDRGDGWKILRNKFSASKTKKIYDAIRHNK